MGSARDQVHTLARRGVVLTPPADIDYDAEDVELSGIGTIDLAAGDDQYVFLTPFGAVSPMFKGSFDKPVLAYSWEDLIMLDPLLRVIDLETFYLRTASMSRVYEAQSDNIFDAASTIRDSYGAALEALQSMAQVPASVALPLMLRLLYAEPDTNTGDRMLFDAEGAIDTHRQLYDFERAVTVAEYLEPSHIDWEDNDEINEFQSAVAAELAAASDEFTEDRWPNMLKVMLDADPSARAHNPQKFWAGHNSPELLVAHPLPVCEAVAFYVPTDKRWYRMPAAVCAEGRAALSGLGAAPMLAGRL
jgi:hypothetical protein